MGRVKLKIKRLENSGGRTVTYTKRRAGILKKAKELSILCDIDIALLMFSPSGRPTLCLGERSTIEGVIAKFAQLTPQERAKRKLESLEALKKTFKKLDHDVNIQDFLGTSTQTAEELSNQSRLLQSQLSDVYHRLSYWTDPDKINNIEHIETMEESLKESLSRIRAHKENMEKEQLMSLECTGQFQTGMHLPLPMGIDAQSQALSWLPNNDGHPLMLHEDPSFLPQRDIDCSLGTPFPNYACYLSSGKQAELDRSGQESGVLTELKPIECSRLQLGGQYPYESYNLHMIEDKKFKTEEEINIQEPTLDYQVAGFEPPRIGDDPSHRYWASTSSPCGVAMFHEPSYPQQHN